MTHFQLTIKFLFILLIFLLFGRFVLLFFVLCSVLHVGVSITSFFMQAHRTMS